MTADGTDDELVKPEGLEDYVIPPPALIEPSADASTSNQNDAEARDEEEVDEEGEDEEGPPMAADDNADDEDLGKIKKKIVTSIINTLDERSRPIITVAGPPDQSSTIRPLLKDFASIFLIRKMSTTFPQLRLMESK